MPVQKVKGWEGRLDRKMAGREIGLDIGKGMQIIVLQKNGLYLHK
jgi:hypothetical protein